MSTLTIDGLQSEEDMYRLFTLYDQGEIVALTGFKPMYSPSYNTD